MATETIVNTTINEVVAEVPNIRKELVVEAIMTNNDVSDALVEASISNMGRRLHSLWKYGNTNYYYGLPNSNLSNTTTSDGRIAIILQDLYGSTFTSVIGSNYRVIDNDYIIWKYLQDNYSWIKADGFLYNGTTLLGKYLRYSLNANGTATIVYDSLDSSNTEGSIGTGVLPFEPNSPSNRYMYRVKYKDNNNRTKYWYYLPETHTYPNLDILDTNLYRSEFYPIIPIRKDKVNYNTTINTRSKSLKKALKKIGLKLDAITDSINDNPDINLIDDAFIVIGTSLYSTDSLVKVANFFSLEALVSETYFHDSIDGMRTATYYEDDLHIHIQFRDTTTTYHSGSIGVVGDVVRSYTTGVAQEDDGNGGTNVVVYPIIILKHQYSSTNYKELQIHDLTFTSFVRISGNWGASNLNVRKSIRKADASEEIGFMIPLNRHVMDFFSKSEQELIGYKSVLTIVNSIQKIHLHWYETFAFTSLLQIIGVGLMAFTAGKSLALTGAASSLASAMALASMTVEGVIVQYTLDFIAKNTSGTLRDLLTLGTILISSQYGGAFKGIDGASLADQLIKGVTLLTKITTAKTSIEYLDFVNEYKEWEDLLSERQDELDKGLETLNTTKLLSNPMYMLNSIVAYTSRRESPEDYYNRTIHTGNIGTFSLKDVETFTTKKLRLPDNTGE
jgi:hypothetical protein